MKRKDAIWITGVGAATPLGSDYDLIADALLEGRSGVATVERFAVEQHPCRIAAQLKRIPCPPSWDEAEFHRRPTPEQLVLWCCVAALRDAGWWGRRSEVRCGLILGQGAEWLRLWEEDWLQGGNGMYDVEQAKVPLVQKISRELHLTGPGLSLSAACASGNHALAQARHWLELDWVDVCLAGACDLGVTPFSLAAFGNLRALTRRNDAPQAASRPFDRERDGFVMGEGGVMFLLEPAAVARRRGAHAYGEVAGCGASSDAHHLVIPSPDPAPAAAALRQALRDAGVHPGDVDYVNAHGTSTPVGDVTETQVLRTVFGEAVARVPVSSTKSMTGHLLTAAAALEALACLAAIERGAIPPTINLDNPDPECDLCHVARQARKQPVRVAVSNSFGFGGSNTCRVLRAA